MTSRLIGLYENLPLPAGQILGVATAVGLGRVRPALFPGSRALHAATGAVALGAGCALNVWALVERRRRTSGRFELEQPESLVTTGPYALSRHPMYVGWWFIHLGIGLLFGSAWVAATIPMATLVEHVGVLHEEHTLERQFPHEFARYRRRVPRYLGLPRRPSQRPTS
ncbi:isoprenylcysteine carboxylmethyltransferase family protein [Agromyces sp. SYSU K20354]|uniref:methyltransferase family protein n=1 Tax=Agromyces cavernae TaxID=2898659 RepID=UPI001E33FD76|nr:isoprenylcysteine carboxylmethyltransferase family protein [Agromyces cavernae]MCD2443638.1 isoprenylcysteine carboxylmethyltransferase family protein [Agromyces cavernae]